MSTGRVPNGENARGFQDAVNALGTHLDEERRQTPATAQDLLDVGRRTSKRLRSVTHFGAILLRHHPQSLGVDTGERDIGMLLMNSWPDPVRLSEVSPAFVYHYPMIQETDPKVLVYRFMLPMEGSVLRFNCSYWDATPGQREANSRFDAVNFSIARYAVDPEYDRIEGTDGGPAGDAGETMLVGEPLAAYYEPEQYGDERQLSIKDSYITDASDIRKGHTDLLRATRMVQLGFIAAVNPA